MSMKTVQLYVVAKISPFLKGKRTRFVGLFVYEQYLRLYSGTILGHNSVEAVFFGVIKVMELLKENDNIQLRLQIQLSIYLLQVLFLHQPLK
ncbi:MAG: hypothetical protein PWQ67_1922 [Clostridia bacterium]|nr:hypothetical protein [Clostridia bacterium]MDN5323468.1 hypothetical protein [Clostridia bacterium]